MVAVWRFKVDMLVLGTREDAVQAVIDAWDGGEMADEKLDIAVPEEHLRIMRDAIKEIIADDPTIEDKQTISRIMLALWERDIYRYDRGLVASILDQVILEAIVDADVGEAF